MRFEQLDNNPDANVHEAEYLRLLGFPAGHELDGRARELADWARNWYREHGKPWVYAREADFASTAETLCVNGVEFTSSRLREQLDEAEAKRLMLVAVSAGSACEHTARQLWDEGKPDEYFFLEMYGSAVVEHLITHTGARLCAWADAQQMAVLPHFSPGYSGWDISEQRSLFQLVAGGDTQYVAQNLVVLQSGMLTPKKSLLAVMGLTERLDKVRAFAKLSPCENCSFPRCQYRRTPYKHARPGIEDVRQLQPFAEVLAGKETKGALERNARYSVNERALKKWSRDRLQLILLEDGGLEARFRYEGTTCSNLGRPLEYQYRIKLAPAADAYRILETDCRPVPGDIGHTYMCEYLANPDLLARDIEAETPLKGRPLNEVLSWKRMISPAGCYCDAESRMHKWGLVLEVIHYTLAMREPTKIARP